MTSDERDRVMRKIRACLALAAEENNASDAERATAMRQGTALMDRYGIQAIDVQESDDDTLGERGEERVSMRAMFEVYTDTLERMRLLSEKDKSGTGGDWDMGALFGEEWP